MRQRIWRNPVRQLLSWMEGDKRGGLVTGNPGAASALSNTSQATNNAAIAAVLANFRSMAESTPAFLIADAVSVVRVVTLHGGVGNLAV